MAATVEVRQDPHDLGEAVDLADVQELERFHLEAVLAVDQQQDQVRGLGQVRHGVKIVRALVECQPAVLAGPH